MMNEELNRLENEGTIENVTREPTPWLNALVIIPKGRFKIKILREEDTRLLRLTICLLN